MTAIVKVIALLGLGVVGVLPAAAGAVEETQPCASARAVVALTGIDTGSAALSVLVNPGDTIVIRVSGTFSANGAEMSYVVGGEFQSARLSPGVSFEYPRTETEIVETSFFLNLQQSGVSARAVLSCIPAGAIETPAPQVTLPPDVNPDGRLNWGVCDQHIVLYPLADTTGVAVYEIMPDAAAAASGRLAFFVALSEVQPILLDAPLEDNTLVKQAGRVALYIQKETGFVQINHGALGEPGFCTFEMDSLNPFYVAQIEPVRRVGPPPVR